MTLVDLPRPECCVLSLTDVGQEDAGDSAVVAPALRGRPVPTSAHTAAVPHTLSLPVPMAASQMQLTECIVVYLHYFTDLRSLAV